MSDLEAKGYLYHPHTSAGRIPTDRAYRVYVDQLMRRTPPDPQAREQLEVALAAAASASDELRPRRAGARDSDPRVGGGGGPRARGDRPRPRRPRAGVDRRILLVLNLRSGTVRSIYIRLPSVLEREEVEDVRRILNERLGGRRCGRSGRPLADRPRGAAAVPEVGELLDIVLAEGEGLFDVDEPREAMVLGSVSVLIDQPEFASSEQMRTLLSLTDRRDLLHEALAQRRREGLTVTIGGEHGEPGLAGFTLVTSTYRRGGAAGSSACWGRPMPYDKIIGLVEHTGRLIEGLIQ